MANLASGVVPNLYIQSVNGNEHGGSSSELDELFTMLEGSDGNKKSRKKGNNNNNKTKSKWKKRKESELPKLHVQLSDAKDDPALLSCNINEDEMVLLRPEQIPLRGARARQCQPHPGQTAGRRLRRGRQDRAGQGRRSRRLAFDQQTQQPHGCRV